MWYLLQLLHDDWLLNTHGLGVWHRNIFGQTKGLVDAVVERTAS